MEFTRFADLAKRPGHPNIDRSRRLPLSNAPGLAFIRYPEVVGNVQFVMEPNLVVDAGRTVGIHRVGQPTWTRPGGPKDKSVATYKVFARLAYPVLRRLVLKILVFLMVLVSLGGSPGISMTEGKNPPRPHITCKYSKTRGAF